MAKQNLNFIKVNEIDQYDWSFLPESHPLHSEMRFPEFRESAGLLGALMRDDQALALLYKFNQNTLTLGAFYVGDSNSAADFLRDAGMFISKEFSGFTVLAPLDGHTWNAYRLPLDHGGALFPGDVGNSALSFQMFLNEGYELVDEYFSGLQDHFSSHEIRNPMGLSLTYHSRQEWSELLPVIHRISLKAFEHAPWFKTISESEFIERYKRVLPFAETELMPVLRNNQGEVKGYALCYKGFTEDELVIKTLTTDRSRTSAGGGSLMADEIIGKARTKGYKRIWHALMHSGNLSGRLSDHFNGEIKRKYGLFVKKF